MVIISKKKKQLVVVAWPYVYYKQLLETCILFPYYKNEMNWVLSMCYSYFAQYINMDKYIYSLCCIDVFCSLFFLGQQMYFVLRLHIMYLYSFVSDGMRKQKQLAKKKNWQIIHNERRLKTKLGCVTV